MSQNNFSSIKTGRDPIYFFVEGGTGYSGIRPYLKRIKEDNDPDLIARMTRSGLSPQEDKAKGPKRLVQFKIEKILQLIGSEQPDIKITQRSFWSLILNYSLKGATLDIYE